MRPTFIYLKRIRYRDKRHQDFFCLYDRNTCTIEISLTTLISIFCNIVYRNLSLKPRAENMLYSWILKA
jgi:hypothetical protein